MLSGSTATWIYKDKCSGVILLTTMRNVFCFPHVQLIVPPCQHWARLLANAKHQKQQKKNKLNDASGAVSAVLKMASQQQFFPKNITTSPRN